MGGCGAFSRAGAGSELHQWGGVIPLSSPRQLSGLARNTITSTLPSFHLRLSLHPVIVRRKVTFHSLPQSRVSGTISVRGRSNGPAVLQLGFRSLRDDEASSMHQTNVQSIVSCVTEVMKERSLNI